MSEGQIVRGRPDFVDHDFGKTRLRRFAPYIYSVLGGMLVHKTQEAECVWYSPKGDHLVRLNSPEINVKTVCGMTFLMGRSQKRAEACKIPRKDAVLCGRCHGTGAVFGKGLREKEITRAEAKRRIGCVMEAV